MLVRRSSDRSPSECALDVGERRASRMRRWLDEAAALGELGYGKERTRPSVEGRTVGSLLQSEGYEQRAAEPERTNDLNPGQ
jgi:hypothetical protein